MAKALNTYKYSYVKNGYKRENATTISKEILGGKAYANEQIDYYVSMGWTIALRNESETMIYCKLELKR